MHEAALSPVRHKVQHFNNLVFFKLFSLILQTEDVFLITKSPFARSIF